jgi:L-iditol 2-dehydrogenase
MKALFKTAAGPGHMELRDALRPQPESGQVLVRVKAAGICGSDLHIRAWDTQVPMNPPMVVGHEFSGVIDEIGEGVEGWQLGDRVTAEPSYSVCGHCLWCQAGTYNLCPERRISGFWADGAFAEWVRVPARRLYRLPENASFYEGAMVEPLACCVHAVIELTGIDAGDRVVITGPGTIGLLAMQVARACGGRVTVIGTETDASRLEIARELGAEDTLTIGEVDPVAEMLDRTGGVGADVVIECSGAAPAVATGLLIARKGGKYTQIGLPGRPVPVDMDKIALKELRVTGSYAQKASAWRRSLELMAGGEIRLTPLIGAVLPLSEWEEGYARMERKEGLKVLLEP